MDTSHVKAFLDVQMPVLMELCGVPHWSVAISYVSKPDGNPATVTRRVEYLIADMDLDPQQIRDLDKLVEIVQHELIHCLIASMDVYHRSVDAFVPGGPSTDAMDLVWSCATEQATEAVCRLLRHRCPLSVDKKGRLILKAAKLK